MPLTIAQELDQANAEVARLTGELAASMDLLAKAEQSIKTANDSATQAIADLDAANKAHAEAITAADAKLAAEAEAHAKTKADLDEATKKLADPAYALAGAGKQEAIKEGEGQAVYVQPKTREQLEAEYARIDGSTIEGARVRAEFREKYKKELGL